MNFLIIAPDDYVMVALRPTWVLAACFSAVAVTPHCLSPLVAPANESRASVEVPIEMLGKIITWMTAMWILILVVQKVTVPKLWWADMHRNIALFPTLFPLYLCKYNDAHLFPFLKSKRQTQLQRTPVLISFIFPVENECYCRVIMYVKLFEHCQALYKC